MAHKILLIDDEKINVALVKFGLAAKGYEIVVAYDGDDGLKMVQEEKPNLIILDIQMPRMNGFEFMSELKGIQGFETTPVIMLTANETMEDVFKVEGVKGYFVKPVKLPPLIEKIVETIGPNPVT